MTKATLWQAAKNTGNFFFVALLVGLVAVSIVGVIGFPVLFLRLWQANPEQTFIQILEPGTPLCMGAFVAFFVLTMIVTVMSEYQH